MSIAQIVTRGYGNGTFNGTIAEVVVRGYIVSDLVAPVLSLPTGLAGSSTEATGGVTTDEGNGLLYYHVTVNASETAATIKASGTSVAVTVSGLQPNRVVSGLTPSTSYYFHYVQDDDALNESNVQSSAQFTLPASDPTESKKKIIIIAGSQF